MHVTGFLIWLSGLNGILLLSGVSLLSKRLAPLQAIRTCSASHLLLCPAYPDPLPVPLMSRHSGKSEAIPDISTQDSSR